jgi:2-phospho-L-lactate/phosphoenolpyruvate guanylyltransferase
MTAAPAGSRLTWSLVVPVKVLARAKSRLSVLAGPYRPALALAMAEDTVGAALACAEVARVIAVTDDPEASGVLERLGALVIADEPGTGLNPALRHGAALAASRWPGSGIGALAADLPALRPAELGLALRAAAHWEQTFVPDAPGSGTTLYAARSGAGFWPRFGPRSAERHRAAGAVELSLPGLASLRRDVDQPKDLRAASGLGLGPRTAEVAARLAERGALGRGARPLGGPAPERPGA